MDRYEKMTDEQLIQKLRDGDNRIVDYIMEKYKPEGKNYVWVRFFILSLLQNCCDGSWVLTITHA